MKATAFPPPKLIRKTINLSPRTNMPTPTKTAKPYGFTPEHISHIDEALKHLERARRACFSAKENAEWANRIEAGADRPSNGKTAEENGNGYVINGYGSLKADGFRVSNEKVAKFLFDYKGGSYAASKEDGSERNVGVIGVRIFTEKVKNIR
jgi:hypothetical protein